MDKSLNERKRKYLHKNKYNKKKERYQDIKSKQSGHALVRNYVKSYFNKEKHDLELLDDFIYPRVPQICSSWWDSAIWNPSLIL